MPSLREDQQPDAVIDLRHGSLHRAPTDEPADDVVVEVVDTDHAAPVLPPAPVFASEPIELDGPVSNRKRRRVAELEAIAAGNFNAAREARAVALEQREHLETAVAAWQSTTAELRELRAELRRFTAARDALVSRERARAEEAARADAAAELDFADREYERLQAEVQRLGTVLAEQQTAEARHAEQLREVRREAVASEREARRAVAAFETAERRLTAADETIRAGAVELARLQSERDAAVAELEELSGGHGRVAQLTERVEDLVAQLGELDDELVALRERAETAEAATASVLRHHDELEAALEFARAEAEGAEQRVLLAQARVDELEQERSALLAQITTTEKVSIELAEAERHEAIAARTERDAAAARATELEDALAAAQAEAEALQRETASLAEQLEAAWGQVEDARHATVAAAAAEPDDGEAPLLAALTELAAPPAPPAFPDGVIDTHDEDPDEEDPDARRAALGYLSALADLPPGPLAG